MQFDQISGENFLVGKSRGSKGAGGEEILLIRTVLNNPLLIAAGLARKH
jgi:hypothetical protein